MPRFMLLIRGGDEGLADYSPEQFQQLLQRYVDWSDHLRRAGQYVSADELKPGGSVVRARDGQPVVDGPYTETKEAVGGYYLVEAADAAEAAEIATGCPVLASGGLVEVREINVYE